jgi:hypothetical protein
MHVHTHAHSGLCVWKFVCIRAYMHTYINAKAVYFHRGGRYQDLVYVYVYTYVYINVMFSDIHAHVLDQFLCGGKYTELVCMHACVCV